MCDSKSNIPAHVNPFAFTKIIVRMDMFPRDKLPIKRVKRSIYDDAVDGKSVLPE